MDSEKTSSMARAAGPPASGTQVNVDSEKTSAMAKTSNPEAPVNNTSEPVPTSADDVEQPPARQSLWRSILGFFWDAVSGPPRERRYIQKLDTYMFSYMCLAYFIKQIDQTNISNAFVSGMQEDLALYGNERNWLNTYFNIGIILGTLPSQMIQLEMIRPSVWIPCCEITWSVLVIGMAFANNIETLYALRFLIGFAEACVFPGFELKMILRVRRIRTCLISPTMSR